MCEYLCCRAFGNQRGFRQMIDGADKTYHDNASLLIATNDLSSSQIYPKLSICGNGVFRPPNADGSGLARMFGALMPGGNPASRIELEWKT